MGQKHAQYARVSSTSDDEPEGHGFGFQEGAATLASWKHAERRHRLRRLLILTVPALGISGLLFLLFGNSSPKHDRLVGDYETKLPTVNSGWQPFPQGSASPHIKRLATHQAPSTEQERIFTQSCIDLWISQGQLCQELTSDNYPLTDAEHFSVVSTWQNGSDARQGAARAVAEGDTSHGDSGTDIKHFRSHNVCQTARAQIQNRIVADYVTNRNCDIAGAQS